MRNAYTTQPALRAAFWECHRQFQRGPAAKRQNAYNATIRSAWVDFVDQCQRGGTISEALAQRATL